MQTCPTQKVQHSYTDAKRLAKRASRSYEQPMEAYRCKTCGCWHVGSRTHMAAPMRLISNNHSMGAIT